MEWSEQAGDAASAAQAVTRAAARPAGAGRSARFVDALAEQSVGELFRLWALIVAACGVAYWGLDWIDRRALTMGGASIGIDARGLLSAIYFSAVTATSVGYGDIVPSGAARVLAIAESIAGLILF